MIELIIVIVVLGILAAFAVPKFMDMAKEARASTTRALLGSIKEATDMIHGLAVIQNKAHSPDAVIVVTGGGGASSSIKIALGYPIAETETKGGISDTLVSGALDNFDVTPDYDTKTIYYSHKGASNPAKCQVSYQYTEEGDKNPPKINISDPLDCS